ncbi:MAG: choloylglycine hydrolase family protein [Ruminococcaceae bacterium]|nr:choloylglycine hydrolase family protein [Oscillospiraceae bacterium]
MCTAISYQTEHHYFGRNLDLERGYGEGVVITPRRCPLPLRHLPSLTEHYAMIGMAAVAENYPLYFEATNETGLSMAGLNFPDNAAYAEVSEGYDNVASFELIPYLLGKYATVEEVRRALKTLRVVHTPFSEELPVSPLHWMIADAAKTITLECTREGMKVYDNPFGVLTNNPTFDYHLTNVSNYMHLHEGPAKNRLGDGLPVGNYSLGMGALGLPGDFSSASRFVRAVFVKEHSVCDGSERASVNQFFHILSSVAMPRGCVLAHDGQYEYTRYSSCCNTDSGVYYYTTYDTPTVRRIDMHSVDLDTAVLYSYPMDE